MSQTSPVFRIVRHPLVLRQLQVIRVEHLTPRVARITLGGPELAGFVSLAPEDHVKLFFPRDGVLVLPKFGPAGPEPLPAGSPKPIGRDYTPRSFNAERGELVVDFFLHGRGVASQWAAEANPGQTLGVAGPRGSVVLDAPRDWHLLVGDETALPSIARRLEEFPNNTRALVMIEVVDSAERQTLPQRPGIEVTWVECAEAERAKSTKLLQAVAALTFPEGVGQAWVAGEVEEVRTIYRHLLHERKLPKDQIHVSGHWRRGVSNHDHHEEIEA